MLSTLSPEKMSATLALLLPALNIDDRADMLGGLKSHAPPEVFEGIRALARAVLSPNDFAALSARVP